MTVGFSGPNFLDLVLGAGATGGNAVLARTGGCIMLHTGDLGIIGNNAALANATRRAHTLQRRPGVSRAMTRGTIVWTNAAAPETISHITMSDISSAGKLHPVRGTHYPASVGGDEYVDRDGIDDLLHGRGGASPACYSRVAARLAQHLTSEVGITGDA